MLGARALTEILGGRRVLKSDVRNDSDLRRGVEAGLPYASLEVLTKRFRLSRAEAATALRVPSRTLARRKLARRLAPDESDRLIRLARVAAEASRILGSDGKASHWLRTPNVALGGEVPIQLVATDIGARQVEEILGHIEYGLIS